MVKMFAWSVYHISVEKSSRIALSLIATLSERLESRQEFWLRPAAVLCQCQPWRVRVCQPPAVAKLTHYSLIYLVRRGLIPPRPAARHRQAPLINTNNPGKSLRVTQPHYLASASAWGEDYYVTPPKSAEGQSFLLLAGSGFRKKV